MSTKLPVNYDTSNLPTDIVTTKFAEELKATKKGEFQYRARTFVGHSKLLAQCEDVVLDFLQEIIDQKLEEYFCVRPLFGTWYYHINGIPRFPVNGWETDPSYTLQDFINHRRKFVASDEYQKIK